MDDFLLTWSKSLDETQFTPVTVISHTNRFAVLRKKASWVVLSIVILLYVAEVLSIKR